MNAELKKQLITLINANRASREDMENWMADIILDAYEEIMPDMDFNDDVYERALQNAVDTLDRLEAE